MSTADKDIYQKTIRRELRFDRVNQNTFSIVWKKIYDLIKSLRYVGNRLDRLYLLLKGNPMGYLPVDISANQELPGATYCRITSGTVFTIPDSDSIDTYSTIIKNASNGQIRIDVTNSSDRMLGAGGNLSSLTMNPGACYHVFYISNNQFDLL